VYTLTKRPKQARTNEPESSNLDEIWERWLRMCTPWLHCPSAAGRRRCAGDPLDQCPPQDAQQSALRSPRCSGALQSPGRAPSAGVGGRARGVQQSRCTHGLHSAQQPPPPLNNRAWPSNACTTPPTHAQVLCLPGCTELARHNGTPCVAHLSLRPWFPGVSGGRGGCGWPVPSRAVP